MMDGVVLCADATPEGGQLAEALRARGYRVVESTPAGIVASAAGRVVSLVVLDVDDAQALAALIAFRATSSNAAVPIVLVGGPDAPVRDLTSAVEAGGDAFLTRPLPIERAVRKVETYVGRPVPRPASRPADVWDVPPPEATAAIPKAPRLPRADASALPVAARAPKIAPPRETRGMGVREPTVVTPREDAERVSPRETRAVGVREPTVVTPREVERVSHAREPTVVTGREVEASHAEPSEPMSRAPAAPSTRDDDDDEPLPDRAPPSSEPPPAAAVRVSRTYVLPAQPSSPSAPPESLDAPPPIRERTMVLDAKSSPASRQTDSPPPQMAPPSRVQANVGPPSLALAFGLDEPSDTGNLGERVLLSRDLQDAIDAADSRLFGQTPPLSPLSAPADENIDALVPADMIEGLRQPLEVEERYEAHDAWTVLGEARASSSGGRPARDATTGDLGSSAGAAPSSEPAPPSTDAKARADATPAPPREQTTTGAKSAPPLATPTDLSLRADEASMRVRPRTGMLDARGLLPVLASCIRRRVDGRLTLRGMDGAVSLHFAGGKIVSARTDRRSRSLAWLLVRERRIDQTTARELDREAESSGRGLGTVLLARGLVPGTDLDALERRYQEELVVEVIAESARAGVFELAEGEIAQAGVSVLSRSTVALAVAALRRRVEPVDALARLGGPGARLRPMIPVARLLEDAMLSPNEERAIRALADRAVGEIGEQLGAEVLPALHVLEQLGMLELEGNTARAMAAPPALAIDAAPGAELVRSVPVITSAKAARPEPAASSRSKRRRDVARAPDPVEPARAAVQRASALAADGDYFAVLGLARDATLPDIRRAYVRRRRELGGLDLKALGLAALLDDRSLALEVLDEAFEVLRQDELRERYRAALASDEIAPTS